MRVAEVFADIEFTGMNGPQLVEAWNEMIHTWQDLGGDNRYATVRRFSTTAAGRRRCLDLHEAIREMRAERLNPAPAAPPRRGRGRPAAPPAHADTQRSLASYTDEFNSLVRRANDLGLHWARIHTSLFESRASGARQLARLRQAIDDAEAMAIRSTKIAQAC